MDTAGWMFVDNASLASITQKGNSEILLCPTQTSAAGAIYYRTPLTLSSCLKWTIEFDLRMHDGNGGDGMAFCFLESPFTNLNYGKGLGIPDKARGLKICFDTYQNCQNFNESLKLEIRWAFGANNLECLEDEPTLKNVNGQLNFLRSADYKHVRITYENAYLKIYIDKVEIGSISNTSGDDGGYADYTSLSTNLAAGSEENITLTPGFHGNLYIENWSVFINCNQDKDFEDSGEKVAIGSDSVVALCSS